MHEPLAYQSILVFSFQYLQLPRGLRTSLSNIFSHHAPPQPFLEDVGSLGSFYKRKKHQLTVDLIVDRNSLVTIQLLVRCAGKLTQVYMQNVKIKIVL